MAERNYAELRRDLLQQHSHAVPLASATQRRNPRGRVLPEQEVPRQHERSAHAQEYGKTGTESSEAVHGLLLRVHLQGPACGRQIPTPGEQEPQLPAARDGEKTPAQQWHRATHRALLDLEHRCMRRTAAEEWNLATNVHGQDCTSAEFVRTFMSAEFNGRALLAKHESEKKKKSMVTTKVLPAMKEELGEDTEVWLRHFPDLYGYRGKNDRTARTTGIPHALEMLQTAAAEP